MNVPVRHARSRSAAQRRRRRLFRAASVLGKAWNFPNTLIGLALGAAGLPFGGRAGVRHNALEFRDCALMNLFNPGGALTLGNVILYGSLAYRLARHERVHTVQGEVFGPLYLPLNLLGMSLSLLSYPFAALRRAGCGPFHGRLNFMEGWPNSARLYGSWPRRA